jgi:hypothetical protein
MEQEKKDFVTEAEREFCFFKLGLSGSFMTSLIDTAFKADIHNQYKLAKGFPELMEVVMKYQTERGYWQDLVKRFNIDFPNSTLTA